MDSDLSGPRSIAPRDAPSRGDLSTIATIIALTDLGPRRPLARRRVRLSPERGLPPRRDGYVALRQTLGYELAFSAASREPSP
jgi:hypothetical protein